MFSISSEKIMARELQDSLNNPQAGALVTFEGWVRNQNEGKEVHFLEYEVYPALANKEGQRILEEAQEKFDILGLVCVHRSGGLKIGEMAVWVGVISVHRGPAFEACQYIIDEVKTRVPIWKKEHYVSGDSGWVQCHHCAQHVH